MVTGFTDFINLTKANSQYLNTPANQMVNNELTLNFRLTLSTKLQLVFGNFWLKWCYMNKHEGFIWLLEKEYQAYFVLKYSFTY